MRRKYKRHVIYGSDSAEVVHITLPPGVVTPPHDHGVSHGRIRVLKGKVFCLVFDKETKKFLRREVFGAGETLMETPDIIHIMGNESKTEPAETIHVYTPKLVMKNYPLRLFKWPGKPKLKRKRRKDRKPRTENLTKKWGPH